MAPCNQHRRYSRAVRAAAGLLAVLLLLALAACGGKGPSSKHTLKKAQYPAMAPFAKSDSFKTLTGQQDTERYRKAQAEWKHSVAALSSGLEYGDRLDEYLRKANEQILPNTAGENLAWSPLNVWLALSMLAETTGGDTRAQLLSLLGTDSIETLRETANALWRDNYRDDGATSCVLANSIWLADQAEGLYKEDTLNTLAQQYYASSFSGPMGDPAYDQDLRRWINEQTYDLLKSYADTLHMEPSTVLSLASTVYFKAEWANPFDRDLTTADIFHAPDGDLEVRFMHRKAGMAYYWGERFSAIAIPFLDNSFSMWIILPDEGISPEELAASGEFMDFLLTDKTVSYDEATGITHSDWENQETLDVYISLPKFDVSSGLDLIPILRQLGVQDVFDPDLADFTPLTDLPAIYTSQITHAARVIADEEKVEAAAFTFVANEAAAAPDADYVTFTADRPFLFAITGPTDLPLFTGIVNQP